MGTDPTPPTQVSLTTEAGEIILALDIDAAPRTARYFLDLVERGRFDGATFHRAGSSFIAGTDEVQLIQGGVLYRSMTGEDRRPLKHTGEPLLADFETTTESGLLHLKGTVSLARDLLKTGDAIPEIFICLRDSPEFDEGGRTQPDTRGFPAFAQVISGMDVVGNIAMLERNGTTYAPALRGQILSQPVLIRKAVRTARS